ncbi:hypothetical protein DIURU_004406 [Diutina rugosa]|uniref:Uncharacterized protein n=1 Tax=Diutina rugosa TaxID=5481 RepID=A0A642UI79_DIURU|nr:uncharacterized protein DIURU_004406 [Diutina rugosa]KAA8899384.1 hypothetical protein DIURU_004406 [Diutina rugosa]
MRHQVEVAEDIIDKIRLDYHVRDVELVRDFALRPHLAAIQPPRSPEVAFLLPVTAQPALTTAEVIERVEGAKTRNATGSDRRDAHQDALAAAVYPILFAACENDYSLMSGATVAYMRHVITRGAGVCIRDMLGDKLDNISPYILQGTVVDDLVPLQRSFRRFLDAAIGMGRQRQTSGANVNVLRERGNNQMAVQAYAAAIASYTQALTVCDQAQLLPQLYTNRAIALIGLNAFAEAVGDLNQAVQHDWSFVPAWAQLGYCHLYLGSSIIALKSYLMALRAIVGEQLPESLVGGDADVIIAYQRSRFHAVMPQFVQRLATAISLTERRAHQQGESADTVRAIVSEVRAILSRLRAATDSEDERQRYYAYQPSLRLGLLSVRDGARSRADGFRDSASRERDMAEVSNRRWPQILTPEVHQDVMSDPPQAVPFERIRRNQESTTQIATETATATGRSAPSRAAQAAASAAASAAVSVSGSGFSRDSDELSSPEISRENSRRHRWRRTSGSARDGNVPVDLGLPSLRLSSTPSTQVDTASVSRPPTSRYEYVPYEADSLRSSDIPSRLPSQSSQSTPSTQLDTASAPRGSMTSRLAPDFGSDAPLELGTRRPLGRFTGIGFTPAPPLRTRSRDNDVGTRLDSSGEATRTPPPPAASRDDNGGPSVPAPAPSTSTSTAMSAEFVPHPSRSSLIELMNEFGELVEERARSHEPSGRSRDIRFSEVIRGVMAQFPFSPTREDRLHLGDSSDSEASRSPSPLGDLD